MFDLFFRSSFDPSVQFIASSGYRGPVCPAGHRLCARTYVMPGWHCDSCEQDLDSGNTGQHCKVCASTCYALGYIMLVTLFTFDTQHLTCLSQFCDFDLCDACCELETVADPPLLKKMPSPRLLLAIASPSRSALVVPPTSDEVVNVSSDESPPPSKIHPFFIRRAAQLQEETHEMRFHALARQPDRPLSPTRRATGRATGRLRLRVSTPVLPPQVPRTASAPQRQPYRMMVPSPNSKSPLQYPDLAGLTISTPPRPGFPNFQPKLLFADSPPPSPIVVADNSPESQRLKPSSAAAVQRDSPNVPVPASPQPNDQRRDAEVQTDSQPNAIAHPSPQPLRLQLLRNELQVLRNELHAAVQIEPNAVAQSSPQPLSLQQLQAELQNFRNELRLVVLAFGF